MGYQNKALKGDAAYNLTVATFKSVGVDTDKMTLGALGVSDGWATGSDEIKTLKANGAVDKAYTYIHASDATDFGCPEGWYLTSDYEDDSVDLSKVCRNDTILPLGNGLLVIVSSASTTLTYSGEVLTEDQPIALKGDAAYNITGNISPTDITLGDISVSSGFATGSDELKTLKDNGAVDKAYTFIHAADAADLGCPAGWYLTKDYEDESVDLSKVCQNAVNVGAGEAFVVMVSQATTTITIPSAL